MGNFAIQKKNKETQPVKLIFLDFFAAFGPKIYSGPAARIRAYCILGRDQRLMASRS